VKVILKEDVKTLGKKGATVEVSEGYARNFLMPKGLAVEASTGALKVLAQEKQAVENRKAREEADAKALAAKIEKASVTIVAKIGEGGKLFGSVTAKDIADALQKSTKLSVDKRKIVLEEPIKTLGSYEVPVRLHPQVSTVLKVKVTSE
jgi:large subunit ribosomal protein L9